MTRLLLPSLISLALMLLVSIPAAADWPMYRHDAAHSGHTDEFGPLTADFLWGWTPDHWVWPDSWPVAADGRVFSVDSESIGYWYDARIVCLNPDTGIATWFHNTGENREINAHLAVDNGRLYFSSFIVSDGYYPIDPEPRLHCIDVTNGSEIWTRTLYNHGYCNSPVLADGVVYFTTKLHGYASDPRYTLRAYDAADGNSIWSIDSMEDYREFWMPSVHQGRLFTAINYESLLCVDALTGESIWERELVPQYSDMASALGNKVFFNLENGDLVALDAGTGATVWTRTAGAGSIAIDEDGTGYITRGDGTVLCIDTENGTTIWERVLPYTILRPPAIAGNALYVLSRDHAIYCLDKTTSDTIWLHLLELGEELTGPAISDGRLYFGGRHGAVCCFGPPALPQTIDTALSCDSHVGLDFLDATASLTLSNLVLEAPRRFVYQLNLTDVDGSFDLNWRRGWQNIQAGETWNSSFTHSIPALQENWGTVLFELEAVDVTPAPWNQPPYPPAGAVVYDDCSIGFGLVEAALTCDPSSGIPPFASHFEVGMTNDFTGIPRRLLYEITVTLANEQFYTNWRRGWQNVPAGETFFKSWWQTIPAYVPLIGVNDFALTVTDVTPPPYNQAPYPPAGDTATDHCTITASEAP